MRITSKYGYRIHPIDKIRKFHAGLDIVTDDGGKFPVAAVTGGTVVRSRIVKRNGAKDATWQWGEYIAIYGVDGKYCYYCHLSKRLVHVGDRVEAGQQIGISGTTGYSTGIHLHFEVRNAAGKSINAADYLGIPNRVGKVEISQLEVKGVDKAVENVDEFIMPAGAKYTTGFAVPARLVGKSFTVKARKNGAVLLGEINSWVKVDG